MITQTQTTPADCKAALELAIATARAIKEAGPRGIPSGQLYAIMMGKLDLTAYQDLIRFLKGQGLITEANHLLTATF